MGLDRLAIHEHTSDVRSDPQASWRCDDTPRSQSDPVASGDGSSECHGKCQTSSPPRSDTYSLSWTANLVPRAWCGMLSLSAPDSVVIWLDAPQATRAAEAA